MKGSADRESAAEAGFSLVALVAGATIMLMMMGVAVPSWKYVMKDAREEELLFRGIQIAEAIERFQKKNGNAPPPSLEVLVKGRYLRKPYKEPMAKNGKWRFIRPGEALAPGLPVPGAPGIPPAPGAPPAPPGPPSVGGPGATDAPGMTLGGFIGVTSFSKEKSLRIFNGRTRYSEWFFVAGQPRVIGKQPTPIPGAAPGGAPRPGMPPAPQPSPLGR